MAFDYNQALKRIAAKASLLEQRYAAMAHSYSQAKEELAELRAQAEIKDREIQRLRMQVEHLTLASTFAPTRDNVEQARALITGLIHDIDRCITDLSD